MSEQSNVVDLSAEQKDKIKGSILSQFEMVPLNVTIQGALGEGRVMSLVMSVHPGLEEDAVINNRIDRMTAILDRQKMIASVPDIEAEIALHEKTLRSMTEQVEIAEQNHALEMEELSKGIGGAEELYRATHVRLEGEWSDNDGRRPFDPRNPKIAKELTPLVGDIGKLREQAAQKIKQIEVDRGNYAQNLAKYEAEITRLKIKLDGVKAKIT